MVLLASSFAWSSIYVDCSLVMNQEHEKTKLAAALMKEREMHRLIECVPTLVYLIFFLPT